MNHGSCVHFNGAQNKLCKRGVAYEQFQPGMPCIQLLLKSARGGTYLRPGEVPGEIKPFPGAQPKERCPFYEEPTDEQVQADRAEIDAALKRTITAITVASKWRVKGKPTSDRAEVVECPICNGRLHLSQSAYNGHVHGKCETPGCVSWME
jgi:hypothetical protein